MKGKNLVKTPGELYAPTPGGVVVSADGVKDYRHGKMQEDINQEVVETANEAKSIAEQAAQSASSMENIVQILKQQGEQDIATVLEHEARIEQNERDIATIQDQIGDTKLRIVTEEEYQEMADNDQLDANTLYFTSEETT